MSRKICSSSTTRRWPTTCRPSTSPPERSYWTESDEDNLNLLIAEGLRALENRPFLRQVLYNAEPRTAYRLPLLN
ncbi:hypothetical protein E1263_12990 [Kribbella antibiotica]|uniref:Uncharacterized protein n=1 Tax=Kribbella antibiotica TaxID=190195 RepID=A0A4R4ZPD4_9ACTN|nr:hypothetical protein [Kribbella antibiotica]TDD60006.1 hypothetical protein E1263_12990 [Kribbella antibiotica]